MPRLFGTDGVRGVANHDLTPDLTLALGRAAGFVLARGGEVVVGRDTRTSGVMLEGALVAGLCSAGADVKLTGIIPTPAVAYLTIEERARAGGVISASHNPVEDNGIKFFSDRGVKTSPEIEDEIEALMASPPHDLPLGGDIGHAELLADAEDRYVSHLVSSIDGSLEGLRVVLDCAYGAAWRVGPRAFAEAGADVVAINAEPDGTRINVDCGSTSLDQVAKRVVADKAHLGLAFDGDADRVLAVDERGESLDGDAMLAMLAVALQSTGGLDHNVVVATVMSNVGFRRALEDRAIEVVATPVGDRNVAEAMTQRGAVLGGEQSGHIIFSRHSTTGDGVLTALKLGELAASSGEPVSKLARVYEPFPQLLLNVEVRDNDRLEQAAELWDEIGAAEASLGEDGRVLVRASGTEPVVRVMVEAVDRATAEKVAEDLADAVRRHLG